MPQAVNPIANINLYTPQPGDPHSVAHPFVLYDGALASGFDLGLNPSGDYSLSFSNGMAPATNNNHATARVYLSAFSDVVSNPIWAHTVSVPPNVGRSLTIATVRFTVAQVFAATQIWVGSWWDDGTYPDSRDGVIAYFRDHPEGGSHHTVPIRIT
jgi:hypothetical protein